MGSVTLYTCPWHNTLLALESVEPIIPLRLLVDRGFKIDWGQQRCAKGVRSWTEQQPCSCWIRVGVNCRASELV